MLVATLLQQTEIQKGKLQLFCKLKCRAIIFLHGDHYSNVVLLQSKRKAKNRRKQIQR